MSVKTDAEKGLAWRLEPHPESLSDWVRHIVLTYPDLARAYLRTQHQIVEDFVDGNGVRWVSFAEAARIMDARERDEREKAP